MKEEKKYTGSVYVVVAESEIEIGPARDSINAIVLRNGDHGPVIGRGTKGFETRQTHLNNFLETKHDFILYLDGDMLFPVDTLERLRSHGLPYVSGYYTRRDPNPIAPIWFKPFSGHFPYEVWLDPVIEKNKLYHIGASGWGCMLVHRDVILAVRELLKGEWEIFEDDMDIYPYDLAQVLQSIKALRTLVDESPSKTTLLPALDHHVKTLENEIRPLKGTKDFVGSDVRFPYFAMMAGYKLYGDSGVRCGHYINYPLGYEDFNMFSAEQRAQVGREVHSRILKERSKSKQTLEALYG